MSAPQVRSVVLPQLLPLVAPRPVRRTLAGRTPSGHALTRRLAALPIAIPRPRYSLSQSFFAFPRSFVPRLISAKSLRFSSLTHTLATLSVAAWLPDSQVNIQTRDPSNKTPQTPAPRSTTTPALANFPEEKTARPPAPATRSKFPARLRH